MDVIRSYNNYMYDTNETMIKTFTRMFLGLLVTAITSFITYKSGAFMMLYSGFSYAILAIIELAVVLIFSFMFRKLSPTTVTVLFYIYAFVNGLTMGTIFACYNINTISLAFLTTALLFGGLALYGKTTNKDMTKLSTIFTVALIVGLIMSIVNLFIGNTMLDIILDWVMLAVFCGLTAYDMNKIQNMQNYIDYDTEKLYIYGAMELYLDFINIFIRLLSILGRNTRRD
jgi:hypothetical protein